MYVDLASRMLMPFSGYVLLSLLLYITIILYIQQKG